MNKNPLQTILLVPAPAHSDQNERRAIQTMQRLHRDALPAIQAKALAWRNGLAALLAGLVSFGLIKGQSDISNLAPPANHVAGLALLAALVIGAAAAHQLLSAAHGRPERLGRDDSRTLLATNLAAAERASRALTLGTKCTFGCVMFLALAVGITWYGPTRHDNLIEVNMPSGTICGTIIRLDGGVLTIRALGGEQAIAVSQATGIRPVASCKR